MVKKRISIFVLICCLAAPSFSGKGYNDHPRHNTRQLITAENWSSTNRANTAFVPGRHGNNTVKAKQVLSLLTVYLLVSNYVEGADLASSSFAAPPPSNAQFKQAGNALTNVARDFFEGASVCPALATELLSATTQALQNIVCTTTNPGCVLIEDNSVVCQGTKEEVEKCIEKINTLDEIRKQAFPVTTEHGKTQEVFDNHLSNLDALLSCLGIPSKLFSNLGARSDRDGITLKYDSPFNRQTADAFLQILREQSPFFKYILESNPTTIIKVSNDEVSLKFDVLSQYCARIAPTLSCNRDGWKAILPLKRVLQKIILAVSGPVTLTKANNSGDFHVATVKSEIGNGKVNIQIFIDQSGSMQDEGRIDILNSMMPEFLSQLQKAAKKDQVFNVKIITLNDFANDHDSMILSEDNEPLAWKTIKAFGGTNLIPIGEGLKIPGAVIAFTDGNHNAKSLDDHAKDLKKLQQQGHFSHPTICAMGEDNNDYFSMIGSIFQGVVKSGQTVEDCMKHFFDNIYRITNPPTAMLISEGKDGDVIVVWQEDLLGLQKSAKIVKRGDTITFGSFSAVVDIDTNASETKEEKKKRLLQELWDLEL